MKNLRDAINRNEILQRLEKIQPGSERRWGRMPAPQMIAHVNDAFRMFMGIRKVSAPAAWYRRGLLRFSALWVPMPWPHGFRARPELDQNLGGSPPREFAADMQELRGLIKCFAREPRDFEWQTHPNFGRLSERDWMRLGYLHTDHHLRQFGACFANRRIVNFSLHVKRAIRISHTLPVHFTNLVDFEVTRHFRLTRVYSEGELE
jgi:Protein of unknown function (DUF1569)